MKRCIKLILNALYGREYYAVIVGERGSDRYDLTSRIHHTEEEAEAHRRRIEMTRTLGPVIHVEGADLMDGTPIYDIKPYVAYADAHPDARSGFVDRTAWQQLEVCLPEQFGRLFTDEERQGLVGVLAQDPRPRYHDDAERVYGMPFAGRDVRFRVEDGRLTVVGVTRART